MVNHHLHLHHFYLHHLQMPQLERLDLSYNHLQFLDAATLLSLPNLLVLKVHLQIWNHHHHPPIAHVILIIIFKVNNNQLSCISTAIGQLQHLEVLHLHRHQMPNHNQCCPGVKFAEQPAGRSSLFHCLTWKASPTQVKRPKLTNVDAEVSIRSTTSGLIV